MKSLFLFLAGAACSHLLLFSAFAQDNAARAAAEREATEERYKLLNSAVEGLVAAQADQQRRIGALADEIRSVRVQDNKIDTSKFVTREELNRVIKALEEMEQKRAEDKKLIREEFDQLKKDISKEIGKMLNAPPSTVPKKTKTSPPEDKGAEKANEKSTDKTDKPTKGHPSATQEGVEYTVAPGNTLSAIITAHNEKFKAQGKKTSLKLVLDANPGLKPTSMGIGQKIFIPLVTE